MVHTIPSSSWRSPVRVWGLAALSLPSGIRSLWVPDPVNKAGARSSGCPWRQFSPAVWTRALSLAEDHFCWNITGNFGLQIFMNLPRASIMKLSLTLVSLHGHLVGVDEELAVEEDEHHLLGPTGMHLWLNGVWFSHLKPLFELLRAYSLRCVEGHPQLIHGDNVVQYYQSPLPNRRQKLRAGPHSLLLLVISEQFWDPSCCLFNQAKIFPQDVKNGVIAYTMDNCKRPHTNPGVIGHVCGDSGDKRKSPFRFLCIEAPLIIGVFPSFTCFKIL